MMRSELADTLRTKQRLKAASLIAASLVFVGCATGGSTGAGNEAVPFSAPLGVGAAITTEDGTFTVGQAERGKRVYDMFCINCHPAAYYEARLRLWENASVLELFDAVSATMPAENPGALSTAEYLDVLAYVFSITGSPSGDAELTSGNMETIRIVNQ